MKKYGTVRRFTDAELLAFAVSLDDKNGYEVDRFRELLDGNLNWHYISRDIIHNHIAPFFYYNLKKAEAAHLVPSWLLEEFSSLATKITVTNMLFFNALKEIAKSFRESQVDFLVLKGMALYLTVYQTKPFRYMSDIDLFIKDSQSKRIDTILSNLGYRICANNHPTIWHSKILSSALKEMPYEKNGILGNIQIDMHWGITKGIKADAIDQNRLWRNPISLDAEGIRFLIPPPEIFLMHLCLHLYKNIVLKESRLVWFCDIIETIRFYRNNLNWDYFIDLAAAEKIKEMVYPILSWLHTLKFVELPEKIGRELERFVKEDTLNEKDLYFMGGGGEGEYYLGLISNIYGLRNKIRFIISLVFPAPSQIKKYYQSCKYNFILFYYPYHWLRSVIKIYRALSAALKCKYLCCWEV